MPRIRKNREDNLRGTFYNFEQRKGDLDIELVHIAEQYHDTFRILDKKGNIIFSTIYRPKHKFGHDYEMNVFLLGLKAGMEL
jgi:hypothetical protein